MGADRLLRLQIYSLQAPQADNIHHWPRQAFAAAPCSRCMNLGGRGAGARRQAIERLVTSSDRHRNTALTSLCMPTSEAAVHRGRLVGSQIWRLLVTARAERGHTGSSGGDALFCDVLGSCRAGDRVSLRSVTVECGPGAREACGPALEPHGFRPRCDRLPANSIRRKQLHGSPMSRRTYPEGAEGLPSVSMMRLAAAGSTAAYRSTRGL
jgi:hypothetical protein